MKKTFFLEIYDSSILSRCKEGHVVSLTPSASYFLHRNSVKYQILNDYYSEKKLNSYGDYYFFEQLKWFDFFDNFLKENISYCGEYNIPMAKANYLRLKYLVDTTVVYSYILSAFFQSNTEIKQIVYMRKSFIEDNGYSIFEFKSRGIKMFYDLLKLFCKKYDIQFVDQVIDRKGEQPQKSYLNTNDGNRFAKSQAKKVINFIKYGKFKKLIPLDMSLKGLNLFFLHAGSVDIDYPIKEAVKRKAHIYVMEKGRVIREDNLLRKHVDIPVLDECFHERLKREGDACADSLDKANEIVLWISNKCSIDVSSVVLPFLRQFVSDDCFYILQSAERMFRFYKQNDIDYVFARGSTDRDSLAPLIAAKYMKGAKSICIQHACFAVDSEAYGVFETEAYNYIITRDDISQEYYEYSSKNRYNSGCEMVQAPYYLRSVRRRCSRKNKSAKVVYVQRKFYDFAKCLNFNTYSLDWYFEFQKVLVDFFAEETAFEFVYKHAQGEEWAEDSMLRYIEDKGCENLDVSRKHFLKVLESADKVIVDIPWGAYSEAAVSGKPVLCICPDYFRIRTQARLVYGKSLQQFSTIEEAKSIIKEFLYGDPQDYIVNIPFSQKDFIDVFNDIRN